jgi:hypothetical protein
MVVPASVADHLRRRRGGRVGGRRELARLAPADLGPLGQVVISPILRESVRTPLLRLPPDPLGFTFNLVRFPPTDDAAEARGGW